MFNKIKNVHFVGIGGSGMSGIAEVLFHSGYQVSGSDIKNTPAIEKLEKMGIKVFIGHASENIQDVHVLVVSSAINKHNPEIIEAQNLKIPIIHRSEMLAELMRMKHGIVVAGTHGKTTTTSILAFSLHAVGLDPTVVIGGKLNSFDSNAKLGKGELFVAEADESDGSFLRLTPTVAVITNIDKDHLDYYGSLDEIVKAFEAFLDKVPFYGAVCLCIDNPIVQLISQKVRRKIVTFGLRQDADVTISQIQTNGFKTTYTPKIYGKEYPEVILKMPGLFNAVNSLASFAVATILDLDLEKVGESISQFDGVLHRYSLLGEHKNTLVVDDYAHNPKKIETVLKGTKESFPNKQIIAIFQPHRYSRIKFQLEEFARCFVDADKLIVTPIFAAGESPISGVTLESLIQQINIGSFNGDISSITVVESLDQAAKVALDILKNNSHQEFQDGNIVITLGAGDVRQAGHLIMEKIHLN